MRITEEEKLVFVNNAKKIFGDNSRVILFGSRIDDGKKGGDIDLMILPDPKIPNEKLYSLKIKYLVDIKEKIGEQKIDVILPNLSGESIIKTAEKTGVSLC